MAQLEQHHEIPTSKEIITHDSNAKNNEDSMVEVDHTVDSTLQTSSKTFLIYKFMSRLVKTKIK